MQVKTLYLLVHRDTGEPCFRSYKTRSHARIAQRSRNSSLGFKQRLERRETRDNWEEELCCVEGSVVAATYVIVESTVEQLSEELWPRC